LLCLFLFVLAAGSANNLVYIYVFFIISMALVGTHLTNRNIDKLSFTVKPEGYLFAGERSSLLLKTVNPHKGAAVNLMASVDREIEAWPIVELPGMKDHLLKIFWTPLHRGYHPLPRIRIQSTFPFDLLKAWHICETRESHLIFPKREGIKSFPKSCFESSAEDVSGLFKGSSFFQSSDSTIRIDWRLSARRQELFVKRFENQPNQRLNLSWEQTSNLKDFECKISQLALWVDEAEKNGFLYSLEIGQGKIEMGRGLVQWLSCMEALAKITSEYP